MIVIVHSIYSQSVHALALNAGSMDNHAGQYCSFLVDKICLYFIYNDSYIVLYCIMRPYTEGRLDRYHI